MFGFGKKNKKKPVTGSYSRPDRSSSYDADTSTSLFTAAAMSSSYDSSSYDSGSSSSYDSGSSSCDSGSSFSSCD